MPRAATSLRPQGDERARLMGLVGAVQSLARARTLEEVVATLRATARAVVGADGIAVVLRDGDHCHYVAEDAPSRLWTGQRFPIRECISGLAMIEGVTIAIPDIRRDRRVPQAAYRGTFVRSMAAAPIGAPEASGALCAYWAEPRPVPEDTLEALHALASAAATAIENGRLFEALEASERRFRNLFQASPVGVAIYDAFTRDVPDVNDTMLSLAGLTRHEFETGAWDFVRATAPEFRERDEHAREEIKLTGWIQPYEKAFEHRDGRRVPVLMMAAPLDGESRATIVVAQELSAIKAAEEALAQSEAMLRGITETVGEVFYTYDFVDGRPVVAYISAAYEDIWGRTRASLLADPMSFLEAVHDEDRETIERAVARQNAGHEVDVEYRIRDNHGCEKWIHNHAYPVKDEAGQVVRIIGVAEDITGRKLSQARAEIIAREMDHRARNLMTIVRGIVGQTLRTQPIAPEVTEVLLGRLNALSAAHKAIMRHNWTHAAMGDLVALALDPFRARTAGVAAQGPDIEVPPQIGLILALALHELATNAMKHGALSLASGRVEVLWERVAGAETPQLRLAWRERGGPPVVSPSAGGFGTDLLGNGLAWYGGESRLDFAPDGLEAEIVLPLDLGPLPPAPEAP